METAEDAMLEHFGVKGMKWGVRRKRGSDGHVDSGTHTSTSADAEKALRYRQVAKKTGTHALSNQELQHLVNRMNLEQNYARLTSDAKASAKVKKGQGVVRELLNAGKMVNEVYTLANSPLVKEARKAATKKG